MLCHDDLIVCRLVCPPKNVDFKQIKLGKWKWSFAYLICDVPRCYKSPGSRSPSTQQLKLWEFRELNQQLLQLVHQRLNVADPCGGTSRRSRVTGFHRGRIDHNKKAQHTKRISKKAGQTISEARVNTLSICWVDRETAKEYGRLIFMDFLYRCSHSAPPSLNKWAAKGEVTPEGTLAGKVFLVISRPLRLPQTAGVALPLLAQGLDREPLVTHRLQSQVTAPPPDRIQMRV